MKHHRFSIFLVAIISTVLLDIGRSDAGSQPPPSAQTLVEMQSGADKGDAVAQHELGVFSMDGDIGEYPAKVLQGVELLTRSAEQGYAPAQYKLGLIYYAGPNLYDCLTQVPEKAYYWFGKAAAQNHLEAQYELASLYNPETGFKRYADKAKYAQWMQKAADLGHVGAQYALGRMYEKGDAVPQNIEQAKYWYQKAAAQGDAMGTSALKRLLQ
jgi:TPR repeat protein